ncbi:MAG: transcriptional regulator [Pseudozobellia sp.]|nr:transcriptional regulator [Pseudozobellia sp.]|tara:strand:- start:8457 stop:8828 length:372 start_codon:yes stop_codon:yes gene_type:complete
MALELSCTRAEADQKQLMRCRETLGTNSEAIVEISKVLALAGNETRLRILFLLNEEGELCPCDFADILEMSVPAISQHIRKMKDVGLITSRREGQTLYYSLVQNHNEVLDNVFTKIQKNKKVA